MEAGIPHTGFDAGKADSGRFYFGSRDVSTFEQTWDAVLSNLVVDGIVLLPLLRQHRVVPGIRCFQWECSSPGSTIRNDAARKSALKLQEHNRKQHLSKA